MINGKIADFPQSEKNILQPQGIQTILIIPLIVDKEFYGFIGFDNCVSEREWTSAEQEFLKAATNILQQNIKRYISLTLLQSENLRFRTTMDALDAMVYVSDLQTYELIFLNKYGRNIFGNKIGIKCYEALQKDMSKPCSFCTNHLLLDKKGNPKEPHVWEFQNSITKQWFQCRDQAIRWTDGRLVKLEIAIDITEKRKIEDALKESEEKFKNFFENNLAVMMQIDSESKKIVGCNAAAVNYYGYSKKELLNKSIDELNDLPAEVINRRMEKAVQRKSNHFHFKHKLANNELRDVEVYSSPIKIKDKIRMFVIVHDITERKKIEAALESNEAKYRTLIEGSNDAMYLLYEKKF
ncbi:MAG: PAS domain S-box protein, partial [Candidatus Aminicenantes bacterium]|nr:PAS domain S-box protein [Candidatus Aminicenantes bacterium]